MARCMYILMATMPSQLSNDQTDLIEKIARCRRVVEGINDPLTLQRVLSLLSDYEERLAILNQN